MKKAWVGGGGARGWLVNKAIQVPGRRQGERPHRGGVEGVSTRGEGREGYAQRSV